MSVVGNNRIGIPIILLHDAEGAIIQLELKNGETIRGSLFEADDMMNLTLKKVVRLDAHGRKMDHHSLFVRGSSILFLVLPNILKHAPMFKRIGHWRRKGGAPPENLDSSGAGAMLRNNAGRGGGRGFDGGRGGGRGKFVLCHG